MWTELTPAASPGAVTGPGVAYDKSLQRMVRVSGDQPMGIGNEQWFWGGYWRDGFGTIRPPAGRGRAMAFDEARQQLVLFGRNFGTNMDTWLSDVAHIASSTVFGNSRDATMQLASGRPLMGTTVNVQMLFPPSIFAFLATGWSNASFNGQPLPVDLTSVGMTGCELLTSSEVVGFVMTAGAASSHYAVSVPNVPAVFGAELFLQGFALDPFAGPMPLVTTNAIEWLISDV